MRNLSSIKRLARKLRREDGNASIEFVILFPAIMTLFLSAVEVGIYLTRSVMLERALDIHVRTLRLGTLESSADGVSLYDELKQRICKDTVIFSDCPNAVKIELVPIPTDTWTFPADKFACVDREEDIELDTENFQQGDENQIMLIRACAILNPFFPTTPFVMQLPLDPSGGYAVTAASTFVNEP